MPTYDARNPTGAVKTGGVLIEVSGGVANYTASGNVRVVILDWDDLNDTDKYEGQIENLIAAVTALPNTGAVGQARREALLNLASKFENDHEKD